MTSAQIGHATQALSDQLRYKSQLIELRVEDDQLVLSGQLSSYYEKQLAQESVRYLDGVSRIRNEIVVA